VIPRLEVVQRLRPIDLVAPGPAVESDGPGRHPLPRPAPYAAAAATLAGRGRARLALESGADRLEVRLEDAGLALSVTAAGRTTGHRSRRHGRARNPESVGLSLTGTHLTAWSRESGSWVVRGRVDLGDRLDAHDDTWLADLTLAADGPVDRLEAGAFGQLGLRDLRFVTEASGAPVTDDGALWLTATSAGPGFFDTGHTSVWRLDRGPADSTLAAEHPHAGSTRPGPSSVRVSGPRGDGSVSLTHTGDVYFRRADRPGVYGDHATHLVRDGDQWLVATSTWGDFDREDPDRRVATTLARTAEDVRCGEHVLDTTPLVLPTDGFTSVGTWDPHLVRSGDEWLVAFVSASEYFRFHPCLASGPTLDDLALRAADTRRRATEGVTLVQLDGEWRVLASDGPDGRRTQRERMPVLDLDLAETGVVDAPYPTNLPWPTLAATDDGWLMVTFDGTPTGGALPGYGTHGDVVVMGEAGQG
jgi:hypothetical protein